MNRLLKFLALATAPVLLAAAPAGVSEKAIDATLFKAYGPYLKENGGESDWRRPVFSAETSRLIRTWERHNGEELTGLNDFGWFCDCQDWDWKKWAWKRQSVRALGPGKVEVLVRVNAGWGDFTQQRLIMVREGQRWLIDDLFIKESIPKGIKAEMRAELKEKPGS